MSIRLSTILLSLAALSWAGANVALAKERIYVNTIMDIKEINNKIAASKDSFEQLEILISPDIGSEAKEISSEKEIAKKITNFLIGKEATGYTLSLNGSGFYYVFKVDPQNNSFDFDRLREMEIKSKLTDLLEKYSFLFQ